MFETPVTGQNTGMTTSPADSPADDFRADPEDDPTEPLPDGDVNLAPGPTDRGGQGGMASREQEARRHRRD